MIKEPVKNIETLSSKIYRKEFVSTFDGDESGDLRPRQTPGVLYSKALPTPVKSPELLAWSDELAKELGIKNQTEKMDVDILGGNLITPSMYPYAACYAGHQFGQWAGQLGDGRAITLGEWEAPDGRSWEMQLKGAGPTAYSRRADGRAVLRSSLREYLMSEAMYHLRVPTTRALSLVTTGDSVLRDMFYDGHPEYEPGAIVMRVSPSFLRFGNFEVLAARNELSNLRKLVDWTIQKYYPHIDGNDKIIAWFKEVVEKTAGLMVEWLRVGFVHGVMNTDNMSILGLTIDYGPYSFIDDYDPNFTPNTTDLPGRRYAFGRQPSIAHWNLGCFAGAIAPLLDDTERLSAELEGYTDIFLQKYYAMMGNKLGLDKVNKEDISLINEFEKTLATIKPDMTIFYQSLTELDMDKGDTKDRIASHFNHSFYKELQPGHVEALFSLMEMYITRIKRNTCNREESLNRMQQNNPRFILRNYLLHQASEDLEKGDDTLLTKLQHAMKEPYSKKYDEFFTKRPDWATQKAGCSMLSCSS
ncbi:MAG: YdiU family protein [Chitinophagaceae bacterium]|nr:YdiU family protein [Chitinophagaceae bacterium]